MTKTRWFSWLRQTRFSTKTTWSIVGGVGLAALLMTTGFASAQNMAPVDPPTAPKGYTLHETIDLGGHAADITGSGAMYNTIVNLHSGPRVLGETFELHALPGAKNTLVDSLSAYSNGFGGDPGNFATLNFYKGNLYEFSGTFRRFREYFDYDLLANPNIPSGQSIPIGPSNAPTGHLPWPQVDQSPFMYNTVRRMTDTNLTLFPLSEVTYRVEYTQNVQEGPSLSPGGFIFGFSNALLQEYQRNSTDDFVGGIDWKPSTKIKLTYEEVIDHYKGNSYFTLAPSSFLVQEADGTPVALGSWDSLTPYGISSCNTNSMGGAYTSPTDYTILSPSTTPGGKPVINPACDVLRSYLRSQPTRVLFPTEIFRFQSSNIKNVAMNGDVRYTNANMSLPNYYENFQGLSGTTRSIIYTGNASAKREVIAVDYGVVWDATSAIRLSEQLTYSNVQQPGTAYASKGATENTPATPGDETINYPGPLTPGTTTLEGNPNGVSVPNFFGQKFFTNDLTATWDGWSRATLSLTYRYRKHIIAVGIPHDTPLLVGSVSDGTVTINENGGILNLAVRPTTQWNVEGSVEALYSDNTYTPVEPREEQHYWLHTMYKPKPWMTLTGVFNDRERHNNTNNNQDAVAAGKATYAGPIDHVDYSRTVSLGAVLMPNQRYGLDLNYTYSDIYTATNICYDAAASSKLPGAATPSGTACPGATVRGTTYYEFGPARDFMDAPTQYASVALIYSPVNSLRSNIGYNISSVDGSRFFNDARDVNGSLVSTYQSPYVSLDWTVHKAWTWKAQYSFYGYGEGGPSGAPYCSTSNPTPTSPAPVVPCNSPVLTGLQTGLTISPAGETAPRNFHANVVTLGMHYEF